MEEELVFYRGWQFSDKLSPQENVSLALQAYYKRYGKPPQVVEGCVDVLKEVPVELNLVKSVIALPKNVILIGVVDGN